MELINRTPAESQLLMGVDQQKQQRMCLLVTKLTWDLTDGGCQVATSGAVPVFMKDEDGPGGLLPRDDWFVQPEGFQVVVVGHARPPEPVPESEVSLRVGRTTHTIRVVGNRTGTHLNAQTSAAEPFSEMPLSWSRAFGGHADVGIDPDSTMRFAHSYNPGGRGYQPGVDLDVAATEFGFPEGYPQLPRVRSVPNLFRKQGAETESYSWAGLPLTALPQFNVVPNHKDDEEPDLSSVLSYRSHPDWRIALPGASERVELKGAGPARNFNLPQVRVFADYEVGKRQGVLEGRPELLALMPDENKFYVVYRSRFRIPSSAAENCVRIRLCEGWFRAGEGSIQC